MTISVHRSPKEPLDAGYVVIKDGDYILSNQYWGWCCRNNVPFVRITLGTARSRYAHLFMDAYPITGVSQCRMLPETKCKILTAIAACCSLKPGRDIQVGHLIVDVFVDIKEIEALATYIRGLVQSDGAIVCNHDVDPDNVSIVKCTKRELPDVIQGFQEFLARE